jgi:hypothetical protein
MKQDSRKKKECNRQQNPWLTDWQFCILSIRSWKEDSNHFFAKHHRFVSRMEEKDHDMEHSKTSETGLSSGDSRPTKKGKKTSLMFFPSCLVSNHITEHIDDCSLRQETITTQDAWILKKRLRVKQQLQRQSRSTSIFSSLLSLVLFFVSISWSSLDSRKENTNVWKDSKSLLFCLCLQFRTNKLFKFIAIRVKQMLSKHIL